MTAEGLVGVPVPVDVIARALNRHSDYRVLRRLQVMDRKLAQGARSGMLVGCALDVETTGLNHTDDAIIELAIQRFWADEHGRIIVTGRPHSWLEDPGIPISEEVTRLTGIRSEDVRGRRIFDPIAASMIADSDFVVAHNAGFDRGFVEKRLPDAAGRPWVCSMRDVDWRAVGFEGRVLSHLLAQMGWFYDAHRAQSDVTALLHLLDHPLDTGGTVLRAAVRAASSPSWSIEAVGAPFAAKDLLKGRGYSWDPEAKLWSREVSADLLDDEIEWAGLEVYGGLASPRVRQVSWIERYATH